MLCAIPSSTNFSFPETSRSEYNNFRTPKKIADYLLWLEPFFKGLINQLDDHFRCFKNWTQWQLRPTNVEVDDGDIDNPNYTEPKNLYKQEGAECKICDHKCTKDKFRKYSKLNTDTIYKSR